MYKITKNLFRVFGVIFPILIGALHTFAHFTDLIKPEVKEMLSKEIIILGESQLVWNAWGVMSVMMGMSFITIGLINISVLNKLKQNEHPPILAIIAMFIYQISVVYVGFEFDAANQFYGGIFGLILTTICAFLSLKKS